MTLDKLPQDKPRARPKVLSTDRLPRKAQVVKADPASPAALTLAPRAPTLMNWGKTASPAIPNPGKLKAIPRTLLREKGRTQLDSLFSQNWVAPGGNYWKIVPLDSPGPGEDTPEPTRSLCHLWPISPTSAP